MAIVGGTEKGHCGRARPKLEASNLATKCCRPHLSGSAASGHPETWPP